MKKRRDMFTKKAIYGIIILLAFINCGLENNPYPYKISDFRPVVQVELKKLAKERQLPSKDTIARNYLRDNCSKEELLKLFECENPLLRVIAFRTLVNRKDKDSFKILIGHLNDTAKVTFWVFDDVVGDFMVSDLLIRKVENDGILTEKEKNILVDSVLFKHSYLENAMYMIQEVEPKGKYYSIIKEKCRKENKERCGEQLSACFALSKFKKKQDLEFLNTIFQNLECPFWIFKSIENNPDEIYFPTLEKYFNLVKKKKISFDDDFKHYIEALASYKSKKSLLILTELLNKSYCPNFWDYNLYSQYIFLAIHKYRNPLYEDLYQKLKPKMNPYVLSHLNE